VRAPVASPLRLVQVVVQRGAARDLVPARGCILAGVARAHCSTHPSHDPMLDPASMSRQKRSKLTSKTSRDSCASAEILRRLLCSENLVPGTTGPIGPSSNTVASNPTQAPLVCTTTPRDFGHWFRWNLVQEIVQIVQVQIIPSSNRSFSNRA
jgi:hypothetical protein